MLGKMSLFGNFRGPRHLEGSGCTAKLHMYPKIESEKAKLKVHLTSMKRYCSCYISMPTSTLQHVSYFDKL